MTPTVVFYTAAKNKHTTMIGKFDYKSISEQSDKFMQGKLPVFNPKVDKRDIVIQDVDCAALQQAQDADDGFDDILAEILAEEQAAKQKSEEDDYKSKQAKKKKNKKGKKKEDL